jgi:hypothetical protein
MRFERHRYRDSKATPVGSPAVFCGVVRLSDTALPFEPKPAQGQ